MYKYPVIDCYNTVQGEGVAQSGVPVILIRFGTNKDWYNAHIESTRPVEYSELDLASLIEAVDRAHGLYPSTTMVHLTGDEPMLTHIEDLIWALRGHDPAYRVSMDTCGAFKLSSETLAQIDHLSVGPKPHLWIDPEMWKKANELRFYVKTGDNSFCELLDECLQEETCKSRALVIPYSLTQEDIDLALRTALELGLRFHIPTYRGTNGFDRNLNGGQACQICNLQDIQAGVNTQPAVCTAGAEH
jgi:organic radical activating enzyme